MMYIFILFMLGCGYYSLTYGHSLWDKHENRLGGGAMISLAVLGTLIPIIVLIMKS